MAPAQPFRLYRPRPPLSEFVDFFWIYEGYNAPHDRERLLPTGTTELVFAADAEGTRGSGIAGPRSECLLLDTANAFSAIAVHFKPGGAFPFFRVPAGDLHNVRVTLDLVWGAQARTVGDRLWEAQSDAGRFQVLEQALLNEAHGQFERHPAVRYALDAFDRSHGACAVGDVVHGFGISSRRFSDLFRNEVGLSPKAFCRLRRFNEVLRRVERLAFSEVDWTAVALSCGYFDQAHFNHDFRAFAGVSPSAYLRDRLSRTHVVA